MARNIKFRRIDDKLKITIDLSKPPEEAKSGKSWIGAATEGVFERLDGVEGMEGYSLSLRLLSPAPVAKKVKRAPVAADADDRIKTKTKKAKR